MNEKLQRIRDLHLFAAFSDKEFEILAEKSKFLKLDKSEALFRIGEEASSFFVLTEGKVKLSLNSPQGVEKVLMIVRPFELFAEAVMFMEKHQFPVNATALQKSQVVSFDSKTLVGFIKNSPDLSLRMLTILSVRLHKQINEIETLSTQKSTSRVLNYLSSLIKDEDNNSTVITLETSKKNLASRLSITPETFSRILQKLSQDYVIEINGRSITIPDLAQYRRYLITA